MPYDFMDFMARLAAPAPPAVVSVPPAVTVPCPVRRNQVVAGSSAVRVMSNTALPLSTERTKLPVMTGAVVSPPPLTGWTEMAPLSVPAAYNGRLRQTDPVHE
jgi:hypothetical protein